jgi:hypothetical protein
MYSLAAVVMPWSTRPGGRVARVTPDGVVTCSVPSSSMTNRQPAAKVFSR